MNKILSFQILILFIIISCNGSQEEEAVKEDFGPLPDNSIYQMEGTFNDQNNNQLQLRDFRGKPVVTAMVFTNCDFACPMITRDILSIQERIPEDKKDDIHFVLISFDPARDTSATLKNYAGEMGLDENWTLLYGSESDVREISMLLDIHYKDAGNGLFSHDNIIHLLNEDGEIIARSEGLRQENAEIIKILNRK